MKYPNRRKSLKSHGIFVFLRSLSIQRQSIASEIMSEVVLRPNFKHFNEIATFFFDILLLEGDGLLFRLSFLDLNIILLSLFEISFKFPYFDFLFLYFSTWFCQIILKFFLHFVQLHNFQFFYLDLLFYQFHFLVMLTHLTKFLFAFFMLSFKFMMLLHMCLTFTNNLLYIFCHISNQ